MVLAELPWVPRWRLTTGSASRETPSPWGVWSLGVTGVRAGGVVSIIVSTVLSTVVSTVVSTQYRREYSSEYIGEYSSEYTVQS